MEATWFEASSADSADGPLRLGVPAWFPVRHAAGAALALQDAAPLLDAIDAWSLLDADWRWTDALATTTAVVPPSHGHARADWRPVADMPPAAQVDLPWPLLRRLPPPPTALAAALRWAEVDAVVVLSRLRLSAGELAAIEPGGVLLIPESMGGDWRGVLRAADEPAEGGLPLALTAPWAPAVLERGSMLPLPAALMHAGVACEVRLSDAKPVAGDCLAGWAPGPIGAAAKPGPRGLGAALWQCADAHGAARCVARGRLMRWGDGWALAIDEAGPCVHDGEETAEV